MRLVNIFIIYGILFAQWYMFSIFNYTYKTEKIKYIVK